MKEKLEYLHQLAKKTKVLYVEDDPFQRRTYLELLEHIFDDITSTDNAQQGIDFAIDEDYDLIISDVEMPGMNGMEMVKKIKEFSPDQIILFISGHHDPITLQKAIQLGIDGYMYKPLDIEQMLSTLETILLKIVHTKEAVDASLRDSVTDTYSYAKFEEDIERYSDASMIIFKIRDFKSFNDYYGYEIGNTLLQKTAEFVNQKLDENPQIAHYGFYRVSGTHFVILCDAFAQVLKPFLQSMILTYESTQMNIDHTMIYFELEGAIVEGNQNLSLSQADSALREAEKERSIVVYEAHRSQSKEVLQKLTCKDRIKRAIQENRFVPYYQPIIDNQKGMISKYEALVRLVLPDGEVIAPSAFLPVAKETKMYSHITRCMIEQVLSDFKDSECSVSMNLSIIDIKHTPTRQFIYDQIGAFSDPKRLIFELLETEDIGFYRDAKDFFKHVQSMGCKVAIDDFGSGFSNFKHLMYLNINYLKIDGSLIRNIHENETSRAIVEMLANFGHRMGIRTIAEFVSTAHIQKIVSELQINESQGYHFASPIPYHHTMKTISKIQNYV